MRRRAIRAADGGAGRSGQDGGHRSSPSEAVATGADELEVDVLQARAGDGQARDVGDAAREQVAQHGGRRLAAHLARPRRPPSSGRWPAGAGRHRARRAVRPRPAAPRRRRRPGRPAPPPRRGSGWSAGPSCRRPAARGSVPRTAGGRPGPCPWSARRGTPAPGRPCTPSATARRRRCPPESRPVARPGLLLQPDGGDQLVGRPRRRVVVGEVVEDLAHAELLRLAPRSG